MRLSMTIYNCLLRIRGQSSSQTFTAEQRHFSLSPVTVISENVVRMSMATSYYQSNVDF